MLCLSDPPHLQPPRPSPGCEAHGPRSLFTGVHRGAWHPTGTRHRLAGEVWRPCSAKRNHAHRQRGCLSALVSFSNWLRRRARVTSGRTAPACRVLDRQTSLAVGMAKVTRNLIRNLWLQPSLPVAFPPQTCRVDRHTHGWPFVPLGRHSDTRSPSTPVVITVGPGHHGTCQTHGLLQALRGPAGHCASTRPPGGSRARLSLRTLLRGLGSLIIT